VAIRKYLSERKISQETRMPAAQERQFIREAVTRKAR